MPYEKCPYKLFIELYCQSDCAPRQIPSVCKHTCNTSNSDQIFCIEQFILRKKAMIC